MTAINPIWWEASHDLAWDRVKFAIRRGLRDRQTGDADAIPATGLPNFDEFEPAYRFGYGVRLEFEMQLPGRDFCQINLAKEWRSMNPTRGEKWEQDRIAILSGWDYEAEDWQPSRSQAGETPGGSD